MTAVATETYKERSLVLTKDGWSGTRAFFIQTDSAAEDPTTAAGLPGRDDAFPGFAGAICKTIRFSHPGEQPKLWLATVEYGPDDADASEGGNTSDPTDDSVKISGGSEFFLLAVQKDFNGKPIVNSAKIPFDPPIEVEIARPFLQLEKNESEAPYAKARQHTNTVNSDGFYGAAAKTLLCADISFNNAFWRDPDTQEEHEYWIVRYKFVYNADGWNPLKVLDVGYQELKNGKLVEIKLDDNMTASRPLALNADGSFKPAGQLPGTKEFQIYKETSFSGLGLGSG